MLVWLWLKKVWVWLKKNWKSVLLGVFTLGIGLLIGKAVRRKQNVVAPELVGAEEVRVQADEEAAEQLEEAQEDRLVRSKEIEKNHSNTMQKLTRQQRDQLPELREDPDELNSFLTQVGDDIRDRAK